jgi:hypothetical protein
VPSAVAAAAFSNGILFGHPPLMLLLLLRLAAALVAMVLLFEREHASQVVCDSQKPSVQYYIEYCGGALWWSVHRQMLQEASVCWLQQLPASK